MRKKRGATFAKWQQSMNKYMKLIGYGIECFDRRAMALDIIRIDDKK